MLSVTTQHSKISAASMEYPQALKEIQDSPPHLFAAGNIECLHPPAVAIVGTRKPTPSGLETARKMGNMFAELGFVVVSGLARGCDTAAHLGCLEAGGKTIAVLAHGLDFIYPPENQDLAERMIEQGGCLLSEHHRRVHPGPALFVRRNRIITGLARAVLAIQPAPGGGTAHAVNFANKQGTHATILD